MHPDLSPKLYWTAATSHRTEYWLANREVLLDAPIEASAPLAHNPTVSARVTLTDTPPRLDIVNAKHSSGVVVVADTDAGMFKYEIRDCQGRLVKSGVLHLNQAPQELDVRYRGWLH